jgi:hypothetical protein
MGKLLRVNSSGDGEETDRWEGWEDYMVQSSYGPVNRILRILTSREPQESLLALSWKMESYRPEVSLRA